MVLSFFFFQETAGGQGDSTANSGGKSFMSKGDHMSYSQWGGHNMNYLQLGADGASFIIFV